MFLMNKFREEINEESLFQKEIFLLNEKWKQKLLSIAWKESFS